MGVAGRSLPSIGRLRGKVEVINNLTACNKKKQLGAFYTPQPMVRFIVNWAVRSPDETVMDLGCGEAVFLLEAYKHLVELGASAAQAVSQIQGVEVDEVAYDRACRLLTDASGVGAPGIICADFFQVQPDMFGPSAVDVIIGNPPTSAIIGSKEPRASGPCSPPAGLVWS